MADTLRVLWVGADGSTWDLLDPLSPARAVALEGLGLPGFTQQRAESGAVDGRRYEGTTWNENTLSLTVEVSDAYIPAGWDRRRTGDDWRAVDAAWRRSVSAEVPGRLAVISGVGRRELELLLDGPAPPPPGINPGLQGRAVYQLDMVAGDNPWWTGPDVTETFRWAGDGLPFFGGAGDTLFYISDASETESASITNPGDRPAWPRWMAEGPFTSLKLGIGDVVVPLPFALAAKQKVYVDSRAQSIVDGGGVNLWPLMGYTDPTFAPIPAGEQVPLTTELVGAEQGAQVSVALTPLYQGPW